jgi:uncharacterized protein YegP (UPF0339 family)
MSAPAIEIIQLKGYKIEIYKDAKSEFRWRIIATNKEIVSASDESFKTLVSCKNNLLVIRKALVQLPVE